jgi:hypothetical protein
MMQAFAPRQIRFHGLRERGAWQIKLYSVLYGSGPLDLGSFESGLRLAESALPQPAITNGRPGLGFLIAHQGRTGDYVILAWWDNENELPLRVFVRRSRDDHWRAAEGSESVCVWDLEILWKEREAYVKTMLATGGSRPEEYLSCGHQSDVDAPD